jgi:V-type H+-transporting ATPase subunit E
MDANDRIKQMVNFILQEAQEKANEIRIKTEHDFNLEKQLLVHNSKLKIQEEFKQKYHDREIQERIQKSTVIGESRVKKMRARENMLQEMLREGEDLLLQQSSQREYATLLKKLIVQAMIKIEEPTVEIFCRNEDLNLVKQMLENVIADYSSVLLEECGENVTPTVTVNENPNFMLSRENPGVVLTALRGRIVCDNTLKARFALAYEEQLPLIRRTLFSENRPTNA